MSVYIEDAVLNTTIMNFIILYLTVFSLRQKTRFFKILFSALFGCFISVLLTFFSFQQTILIILKLLSGVLMSICCIEKFSYKTLILFFVVFASFTFLMGGFAFFIIYLFGGQVYSLQKMCYQIPVNLSVIFLLLGIYIYLLIKAIQIFYKKQKLSSFYYNLILKINNKKLSIKGYLDSGNLIQDAITGLPIIIISFNTLNKFFKQSISVIDFLTSKLDKKIKGRYIDVNTINSNKKMFVLEANEVLIKNENGQVKKINALIGVSSINVSGENFEALLSPLVV